jgi:anhydro-N-acetylmuramic acid kinase
MTTKDIDLIGMHGQTVWHQPPVRNKLSTLNFQLPTTLQLGSAPALCSYLGIPVISDFRAADIAFGGQGAPLVPVFDREFLLENNQNVIALNIGGIANITYLPVKGKVLAFDTGPGNVLIDGITKKLFFKDFDKSGKFASKGKLSKQLWDFLLRIEFIKIKPPKSTGREIFSGQLIEFIENLISQKRIRKEDAIFTITKFTAWSIAENIRLFASPSAKIIVSGGGSKNNTLMKLLKSELKESKIIISDNIGINSDAKEAISFAYLAWRNLAGLPGNIKSVTGASKEVTLGSLTLP